MYAGADTSALAAPVTLWRNQDRRTTLLHGGKDCWRGQRPGLPREPVQQSLTSLPASKTCSYCVDIALRALPAWDQWRHLARCIKAAEARFLRTALMRKSKRLTPEDAAAAAQKLRTMAARLPTFDGDVQVVRDGLERLWRDRADELSAVLTSPSALAARSRVLRRAKALGASTDASGWASLDPDLVPAYAASSWESRERLNSLQAAWIESVADGVDLPTARALVLKQGLASSMLTTPAAQADFVVPGAPHPGETGWDWLNRSWRERVTTTLEKTVVSWEESFLRSAPGTSLVRLPLPSTGTRQSLAFSTLLALAELHEVERVANASFLLVPTDFLPALKACVRRLSAGALLATDADGVDAPTASTAALLYDPAAGLGTLEVALEAARAL